jgi:3-hydroxyacyl-CoA dehydrogenase
LDIKKVGVIGAGAMGLGIAQVCAQAGCCKCNNKSHLNHA